ncbi:MULTISPECIES: hypothetical protein [unclassified Paenibacillus]|uniref:hypothetical protein n=1 Tax=unclassified Paenibacillus TaxID=185978 RepID=UPI00020D7B9D|nr:MULTISPECIES: hypothetical protein [unclassified Paenibacillus]EGL18571.1 hypothetical protein HMPREF9413_5903 [Paenibacillus sp. HGF7]EPD80541.1 hypothetical protein HMPREF1207_05647 [Paenibacillus sp. HGH0039]
MYEILNEFFSSDSVAKQITVKVIVAIIASILKQIFSYFFTKAKKWFVTFKGKLKLKNIEPRNILKRKYPLTNQWILQKDITILKSV